MRDDILLGWTRCPVVLAEYLERIGGTTPYGEPMWRLVLAESVWWKVRGGAVWDESLSIAERGGIDGPNNRPLRDESDRVVLQERYSWLKGWILQKWFPPSNYDKAAWENNRLPNGQSVLGPYPQFGDYEIIAGAFTDLPTESQVYEFISRHYRAIESRTGTAASRAAEALSRAWYTQQERERKRRDEMVYRLNDASSYIRGSSLEAGRTRTERAEKIGIREHVGN